MDPRLSKKKSKSTHRESRVHHLGFRWSCPKTASNEKWQEFCLSFDKIGPMIRRIVEDPCDIKYQLEMTERPVEEWTNTDDMIRKELGELPSKERMMELMSRANRENWHFQGKIHLQGKASHKVRPKSLAKQLQKEGLYGIECQAESAKSVESKGLDRYVGKCETREAGPWDKEGKAIKPKWTLEDEPLEFEKLTKWQEHLCNMILEEPTLRLVNIVIDGTGCAGKSTFVRFLRRTGKVLPVLTGDKKDMNTQIYEDYEANGGARRCYIWDITRADGNPDQDVKMEEEEEKPDEAQEEKKKKRRAKGKDHTPDIMSVIEGIKSGAVSQAKWHSKTMAIPNVHVIIFTNNYNLNTGNLSKDRIRIWQIRQDIEDFYPECYDINAEKDRLALVKQAERESRLSRMNTISSKDMLAKFAAL